MKLSDKILAGFFGLITIYMFAAFIEVRVRGDYNRMDNDNAMKEEVPLPDFNYLIIRDLNKRVTIRTDATPRIELRSLTGDKMENVNYTLNGDTLILTVLKIPNDDHFHFYVYVPEAFDGLEADGASIDISELDRPVFTIRQRAGRINFSDSKIGKLTMESRYQAHFDSFKGAQIDTLVLTADESNIEIRSRIKRLEGAMTNDSWFSVYGVNELAFTKDETSGMRIVN